jgi:tetratricopeptide (TPR) repeat protein
LAADWAELFERGNALVREGRYAESLVAYEQVLSAHGEQADVLNNRGFALAGLNRHRDALDSFERALALQPDFTEALNNSGLALANLGRRSEAMARYDRALALSPTHVGALTNRGNACYETGQLAAALECYERVLRVVPDSVNALNGRGHALLDDGKYEEALGSFDKALGVRSDFVEALNGRGLVLSALRRFDEAFSMFDQAQVLQPAYAGAHANEALLRLKLGDFRRGLRKYEWRWLVPRQGPARKRLSQPLWLGRAPLEGRSILVHAEQGLGDVIQFCRYIPMLAARGASVVLAVPETFVALMAGLPGVSRVVDECEPLPITDWHCPLLSLPLAFDTALSTIPSAVPYLLPPADRVTRWKERFASPEKRLRVGLAWKGSRLDRKRSITFGQLETLLIPEARFVVLQKDVDAEDQENLRRAGIVNLSADIRDFADTAALISQVDLVISIDTSVAHLAGALGKPTWVLLSYVPDWRWFMERADSPWYPTARLFRQSAAGDWQAPLEAVRKALEREARRP